MAELTITHTSTVTEDQIDHLGHMNVSYYARNARRGTRSLLQSLGVPNAAELIIADTYTRHHHEQLLGNALEVRSGILGIDSAESPTNVRIYHELVNAASDQLAATFVHAVPLPAPVTYGGPTVDIPTHGATRSIDLGADPVGSAPSLETALELGLAFRRPREIGDAECEESNHVVPHMITHLIWGGESPSGTEEVWTHIGPNGENMGWATMETRITIARLPERGSRIQSFRATTAIANKTTQMSMWAYDVDAGDLLVSFEIVSLAFNIDARRSMPIPPERRAREQAQLRPELAPR